jgi:hypothetical protein
MRKKINLAFLSILVLTLSATAQQDKNKRPSPPASAQCKFSDGKTINVEYSSPRVKGRKIFGGLVPYGEIWRAGANEATSFVTNANLAAEGKDIPAGSYTIFTIPAQDKWTLIVNKHTGEWGVPYKYQSEELARLPMRASSASNPVENFTISFNQGGGTCAMQMNWESTQSSITFTEKK